MGPWHAWQPGYLGSVQGSSGVALRSVLRIRTLWSSIHCNIEVSIPQVGTHLHRQSNQAARNVIAGRASSPIAPLRCQPFQHFDNLDNLDLPVLTSLWGEGRGRGRSDGPLVRREKKISHICVNLGSQVVCDLEVADQS